MFENGEFGIAQQQVASLFQVIPTSAPKWLKRLLGKDASLFQIKVKTNREKIEGKRVRSSENAISIADFERVIRNLDRESNKIARNIVDDLIGLSLTQLWSDAFDIEFEKRDRQEWLKSRQEGRLERLSFTGLIEHYIAGHPELSDNYKRFIFVNVSDLLNKAVFGKTAKQLCDERKVNRNFLRDSHDNASLRLIGNIEAMAKRLIIKRDIEPKEAMKEALDIFC